MLLKNYLILLLFITCIDHAQVVIQASNLSCGAPTIINESAIVELDVDLDITGLCELISAGGGFGANDTVTFCPASAHCVNIKSNVVISSINIITVPNPGIWDVRSFNQSTQKFIFDNVTINMDPGGTILADGVTFQLNGTSQIITNAVTVPAVAVPT